MLKQLTLTFISNLQKNNHKDWFEANRPKYEAAKLDFENLVTAILDEQTKKDPELEGLTAKKCIFRINRDVRFSKNKDPYKSNFGASMDRGGKKSKFAGYYFHLEPNNKSMIGGGLWMPEPPEVKKVRQEIDYSYSEFLDILKEKKFKRIYKDLYRGDDVSLVKVPQGFEKDNPAAAYLKLKSWFSLQTLSDDELTSNGLIKKVTAAYIALMPLLKFLNRAVEDGE